MSKKNINYSFVGIGQCGSNLSIEFSRLNYYVTIFNTATSDIMASKKELELINGPSIKDETHDNYTGDNFKISRFGGYEGAYKNREIGKLALMNNQELIKNKLIADKELKNSDFVWCVAGLGGGTGSGSISDIAKIISLIIRKKKRVGYIEKNGKVVKGKSTVGIIAMWPDKLSGPQIKLNAAETLIELMKLQSENIIGSILLIDNEKLINRIGENDVDNWKLRGNKEIANILDKISKISKMPSLTSSDPSEMLDLFSTNGFLSIKNMYAEFNKNYLLDDIIKSSLENDILADGFDSKYAEIFTSLIIKSSKNTTFTENTYTSFIRNMYKYLTSVQKHHEGLYETSQVYDDAVKDLSNKYKTSQSSNERIEIINLIVYRKAPESIIKVTDEAIESQKKNSELFNSSTNAGFAINVLKNTDDIDVQDIQDDSDILSDIFGNDHSTIIENESNDNSATDEDYWSQLKI